MSHIKAWAALLLLMPACAFAANRPLARTHGAAYARPKSGEKNQAKHPARPLDVSIAAQSHNRDPFAYLVWEAPVALPDPPPPPPPPTAPPLPFAFLGKLIADGKPSIFLSRGDENLVVRQGDTIDNLYTVDAVGDNYVVFEYLPLHAKQTLITGASN